MYRGDIPKFQWQSSVLCDRGKTRNETHCMNRKRTSFCDAHCCKIHCEACMVAISLESETSEHFEHFFSIMLTRLITPSEVSRRTKISWSLFNCLLLSRLTSIQHRGLARIECKSVVQSERSICHRFDERMLPLGSYSEDTMCHLYRGKRARYPISMHMIFFYRDSLVYDHAVPRHTTVTSSYYSNVLRSSLLRHLRMKRPGKVETGWVLHHDNAPAHTARLTQECLRELNVNVLPHPPYSPDLAPCDFWLFPTVNLYEARSSLPTKL